MLRRILISTRVQTIGKIKTPPLVVCHGNPLNMFYNMWNLRNGFRLPVKACRPPPQLIPGFVLTTVQGLLPITNRAGKFKFNLSKERINFYPLYRPAREISQAKKFVKFFQSPLTNSSDVLNGGFFLTSFHFRRHAFQDLCFPFLQQSAQRSER